MFMVPKEDVHIQKYIGSEHNKESIDKVKNEFVYFYFPKSPLGGTMRKEEIINAVSFIGRNT